MGYSCRRCCGSSMSPCNIIRQASESWVYLLQLKIRFSI